VRHERSRLAHNRGGAHSLLIGGLAGPPISAAGPAPWRVPGGRVRDGAKKDWQPVCCSDPARLKSGFYGAVAQLVAHLHGMEGVRGSNPLSSTDVWSRDMSDM
jgi:hypothetical protein